MTGPDRIPDEVWEDITRAGQLADDLAARGQQVRFDTHRLTGRVVASLCDNDGRVMRPVALGEVLGPDTTTPTPPRRRSRRSHGRHPAQRSRLGPRHAEPSSTQLMAVERLPRNKITLEQSRGDQAPEPAAGHRDEADGAEDAASTTSSRSPPGATRRPSRAPTRRSSPSRAPPARPPAATTCRSPSLASAERRTYDFQPPAADGPLQIFEADGTTLRASVDLKAGATVDDAVAAINASTGRQALRRQRQRRPRAVGQDDRRRQRLRRRRRGQPRPSGVRRRRRRHLHQRHRVPAVVATSSPTRCPASTLTLKGKTAGTDTVGVTVGNPGPDKDASSARSRPSSTPTTRWSTTTRADLAEKRVAERRHDGRRPEGHALRRHRASTACSPRCAAPSADVDRA